MSNSYVLGISTTYAKCPPMSTHTHSEKKIMMMRPYKLNVWSITNGIYFGFLHIHNILFCLFVFLACVNLGFILRCLRSQYLCHCEVYIFTYLLRIKQYLDYFQPPYIHCWEFILKIYNIFNWSNLHSAGRATWESRSFSKEKIMVV